MCVKKKKKEKKKRGVAKMRGQFLNAFFLIMNKIRFRYIRLLVSFFKKIDQKILKETRRKGSSNA